MGKKEKKKEQNMKFIKKKNVGNPKRTQNILVIHIKGKKKNSIIFLRLKMINYQTTLKYAKSLKQVIYYCLYQRELPSPYQTTINTGKENSTMLVGGIQKLLKNYDPTKACRPNGIHPIVEAFQLSHNCSAITEQCQNLQRLTSLCTNKMVKKLFTVITSQSHFQILFAKMLEHMS